MKQPLLSPKADKADKRVDIKVTAGPVRRNSYFTVYCLLLAVLPSAAHVLYCNITHSQLTLDSSHAGCHGGSVREGQGGGVGELRCQRHAMPLHRAAGDLRARPAGGHKKVLIAVLAALALLQAQRFAAAPFPLKEHVPALCPVQTNGALGS